MISFHFFLLFLFLLVESTRCTYKQTEQTIYSIDLPSLSSITPNCPFCDLSRCHPLPFCYTLRHKLRGRTGPEYCASEYELASMVRDKLANDATHDACQPARSDHDFAYCWCTNRSRITEEDQLREVRIWRFQPLFFHAIEREKGNMTSFVGSINKYSWLSISLLLLSFL